MAGSLLQKVLMTKSLNALAEMLHSTPSHNLCGTRENSIPLFRRRVVAAILTSPSLILCSGS